MQKFKEEFLGTPGKILVKFGAEWCGPCKSLSPVLEELANSGYNIYEVDADEEPDLVLRYGVRTVPTMFVFENGEKVKTIMGVKTKSEIIKELS